VIWQYGELAIATSPKKTAADSWAWYSVAEFRVGGILLVRWTRTAAENTALDQVGTTSSRWIPDDANPPAAAKPTPSLLMLLGEQGWELVAVTVTRTMLTSSTFSGWTTPTSMPIAYSYEFKRPTDRP
jgi:hypothetical protein